MSRPFQSDWLPPGWRPTKLRSFLTRRKRTKNPDLQLLSVNLPQGVVPRQEEDGRPAPSLDLDGYQEVRPNDLVMNQLGKPHGALGVSAHHGIISPAYFVAEISEEADPRFVHHLLRTRLYISEYERRGKYMPPSQFDISWEQFRDISVILPPLTEQRVIADYLDTETARIDALISKKRKMIELLDERTRHTARTLIAKNGHAAPLRRFIDLIKTGTTPPPGPLTELAGDDIAWISPGDMDFFLEMKEPSRRLAFKAVSDGWCPSFPPESTLVVGIGATVGRVGYNPIESTGNQQITCIKGNGLVLPRFLSWQLWARSDEVREIAPYTTLPILNHEFLRSLPIYAPALDSQRRIVDQLDQIASRVSLARQFLKRQVGLLEEHLTASITAVVTGEMPVQMVTT